MAWLGTLVLTSTHSAFPASYAAKPSVLGARRRIIWMYSSVSLHGNRSSTRSQHPPQVYSVATANDNRSGDECQSLADSSLKGLFRRVIQPINTLRWAGSESKISAQPYNRYSLRRSRTSRSYSGESTHSQALRIQVRSELIRVPVSGANFCLKIIMRVASVNRSLQFAGVVVTLPNISRGSEKPMRSGHSSVHLLGKTNR